MSGADPGAPLWLRAVVAGTGPSRTPSMSGADPDAPLWRRAVVAWAELLAGPAGREVRIRSRARQAAGRTARTSTSVRLVASRFVRVQRVGAPGAGAERRTPDVPGDGRVTFVLLHGVGLSSRYLLPLAEDLADHGEVLAVDLPGFGDLPAPTDTLTMNGFARLVHELLAIEGVTDPVLVGHSMGAQVAVEMLAAFGAAYSRAVLVAPPVNAAERSIPLVAWRYVQSAVHETRRLRLVAARSYLAARTRWLVDLMPQVLGYPVEDRFARAAPGTRVVILHGEHDRLVPPDWARALAGRLDGVGSAETRLVPGAAHSLVVEHHPAVVRAAVGLLAADEAAGPGAAEPPGSPGDDGSSLTDGAGLLAEV